MFKKKINLHLLTFNYIYMKNFTNFFLFIFTTLSFNVVCLSTVAAQGVEPTNLDVATSVATNPGNVILSTLGAIITNVILVILKAKFPKLFKKEPVSKY